MRKSNALLFMMLLVVATVFSPTEAVSQAGTSPDATQTQVPSLRPELLEDSKALAAVLNECKGHSGTMVGHAIGDLKKRLGKNMPPKEPEDITTMLRIADDCTAYLSSPELVSGMELPAAQEARREADITLHKLNAISRTVVGNDLQSLKAQTSRQHLQFPTVPLSATASIRQQPPVSAVSGSATVQPLVVYLRASGGPELPGRMAPEEVQAIITEASREASRETNGFLTDAGSTVSADLLQLYNATSRYPNFVSHPLMQSIVALKRQLGKALQPKDVSDVQTVTELLSRTLRIFGGSEFQLAYRHIDAELRAVDQYKTQQAAIISTASTIANVEQELDQGRLMDADSQYQRIATDSFMSGFPVAQRYLAETSLLRMELSAFREATEVPRVQGSQQLVGQVNVLANEVAKAEASSNKMLASVVFKKNMGEDRQSVHSRLASLSAFDFDPKMYRIPPITTEIVAIDAATRLEGLNGKLGSTHDLINLLASPDAMSRVRLIFGEALEAEIRQKGTSIPLAQEMAGRLSSAIQSHQQQVAAAETRRQAEVEEQQALAGKIFNGSLITVMLEEKFQRTSVLGYQMEADKQRAELRGLLARDRRLLTPQVWKAVQSQFEQLMPGLTVYQASATRAMLSNLRASN